MEFVRPGMRLGLGSGSTASHFVELLAERVRAGLDVIGVPTSEATRSDAERLGVASGDEVEVRSNGTSVGARVAISERMRPGAAFLIDGTVEDNANVFDGAELVEIVRP